MKSKEMKNYKVTFKCDETNKSITIKVKALGICSAIEEAIRQMLIKPIRGKNFYYPIKAEGV